MRGYKARGIVLHTVKYGDSSLVAYLLTDVAGRTSYMAQGVRRPGGSAPSRGKSSRGNRAALLQPMFLLEIEGYEAPRAEMHRLREVQAAVPLHSIPFDVRKSTVALFMAEMLYRLVHEVGPDSPLFDFVWRSVEALDGMGARDGADGTAGESAPAGAGGAAGVANFHLWFMVGLSRHLGFFPGNEWAAGHRFDIREGLFVPTTPAHGLAFSLENSALLGRLTNATTPCITSAELAALGLNRTQRVDFLNSMLAYFGYHLDAVRDIRSVDILREVF